MVVVSPGHWSAGWVSADQSLAQIGAAFVTSGTNCRRTQCYCLRNEIIIFGDNFTLKIDFLITKIYNVRGAPTNVSARRAALAGLRKAQTNSENKHCLNWSLTQMWGGKNSELFIFALSILRVRPTKWLHHIGWMCNVIRKCSATSIFKYLAVMRYINPVY